jgi:hypothetical protein
VVDLSMKVYPDGCNIDEPAAVSAGVAPPEARLLMLFHALEVGVAWRRPFTI